MAARCFSLTVLTRAERHHARLQTLPEAVALVVRVDVRILENIPCRREPTARDAEVLHVLLIVEVN